MAIAGSLLATEVPGDGSVTFPTPKSVYVINVKKSNCRERSGCSNIGDTKKIFVLLHQPAAGIVHGCR